MPDLTENQTIVDVAQEAAEPVEISPGIFIVHDDFTVRDLRDDLDRHADQPKRKTGAYTVTDVDSFAQYLDKHGTPATEVWAHDGDNPKIRAVINAHDTDQPGWADHTLTLALRHSPDWQAWTGRDGKYMTQTEFAEFIEDHLPNFVTPTAADMLELAQTFQATTKVDFASSKRINSGETQLQYVENTTAGAGKKGDIPIPDTFTIGIKVFDRDPSPYKVIARFRYRIRDGVLALGYRLTRADDVKQDAFDQIVTAVASATGDRQVWSTR